MAVIRLEYNESPVGVMFFNYAEAKKFSDGSTRQLIEAFTNFVTVALINEGYIARIQEEREKINNENELLISNQAILKAETQKLNAEKEKIQFAYEKVYQKMEEMIPRATKASYYAIMQGVSHDIRNLLLGLNATLYSIQEEGSPPSVLKKRTDEINASVKYINNLLNLF